MHIFDALLSSILVLVIIAALGLLARQHGVLKKEMAAGLARIVFDFGIPALIFVSLANIDLEPRRFAGTVIMIVVELCMIALAWVVGKRLDLTRSQLGAVVLCSAFGTSATLGYSIVSIVFPSDQDAMVEAVLICELGVGVLVMFLGPLLAMHFSTGASSVQTVRKSLITFLKTPLCIALVAGMLWGTLGLPGDQHPVMKPIFQVGHLLAGLVVPLAILIISLNLYRPRIKQYLKPFGVVVLLKLLLAPLLGGGIALAAGLPEIWRDDLIIMAGMPPAVLNTIFLQRYGGDAGLASALTAGASLLSLGTLLLVIAAVG